MAIITTLLVALLAATTLHVRLALSNPSKYKSSIELRQSILGKDPFDHSWISQWAALGDSFASGIGAGNRVSWRCSRYDMAYGQLIDNDESLGTNPSRKFNYLACAGHTTKNILDEQVNKLSDKQMMITISAGGNDVGFGDLVEDCIFQYTSGFDCNKQLKTTRDLIQGAEFARDLDELIQATRKKLAYPNSRIFWTAYAKYFDTTTKECDTVTWASWVAWGTREILTQARRTQLNDLVDLLNGKIEDAVKRAGPQVVFVKWEDKVRSKVDTVSQAWTKLLERVIIATLSPFMNGILTSTTLPLGIICSRHDKIPNIRRIPWALIKQASLLQSIRP